MYLTYAEYVAWGGTLPEGAYPLAELKARKHFLCLGPQKYAAALTKLKKDELWQDEMDGHTDASYSPAQYAPVTRMA